MNGARELVIRPSWKWVQGKQRGQGRLEGVGRKVLWRNKERRSGGEAEGQEATNRGVRDRDEMLEAGKASLITCWVPKGGESSWTCKRLSRDDVARPALTPRRKLSPWSLGAAIPASNTTSAHKTAQACDWPSIFDGIVCG